MSAHNYLQSKRIEQFVRNRDIRKANRAIAALLRDARQNACLSPELRFQCCDWLRRLSRYRDGYLLVAPREAPTCRLSTKEFRGKELLWAARFLNLMGASEFAISLLSQLELTDSEDERIAGNIYLVHFDHDRAIKHLTRACRPFGSSQDYLARVTRLSLADAYSGAERFEDAIELVTSVIEHSPESLMRGVSYQARGEYHAKQGRYHEALQDLRYANELIPIAEEGIDRALLLKWTGFVIGKLGQKSEAVSMLNQAETLLKSHSVRPEAWLDTVRLRWELGLLDEESIVRMNHYPGLSAGFRRHLPSVLSPVRIGRQDAPILIDLGCNEVRMDGTVFVGLGRELQLISMLAIAGSWGLSAMKIKSVLWAQDVYSFLQLDERLHQLVFRLKNEYHLKVVPEAGRLTLSEKSCSKIQLIFSNDSRPSFLRLAESRVFTARVVSKYYNISKTQTLKLLREWQKMSYINASGGGKSIRYFNIISNERT